MGAIYGPERGRGAVAHLAAATVETTAQFVGVEGVACDSKRGDTASPSACAERAHSVCTQPAMAHNRGFIPTVTVLQDCLVGMLGMRTIHSRLVPRNVKP
jgi:hypothetical protein